MTLAPTVIAVFDFDGTLTTRDSLMPFLLVLKGRWRFIWGLVINSPALVGFALKLMPNWQAKEQLLVYFLAGMDEARFNQVAAKFATQKIPQLLRAEAVARLRWHQSQGHQTFLVSASIENYLIPWAKEMGFDRVIGTRLEIKNKKLTGRLLGNNCYGPEKKARLEAALKGTEYLYLYAYGDSKGDREMLAMASHAYYRRFAP
jgi:HAD superfamily hydrolase (TIGR01490 family)